MGCNPLGAVLVLGLISASQLWEGVHCQGYSIDVPRAVSVQEGLCVVVRCSFTYPKSDPNFTGKKLYGYWYEDVENGQNYPAFATNKERKEIMPGALGRFRLSENLEEGDCSLFITDAQPSDQKDYIFRMQKWDGYSFFPATSVRVEEKPKPEVQIPGKLQAGQPVNMTCAAASCPWKSPNISWEFTRNISGILSSSSNGTKMSSFVSSFVPSAADNGQNLTCRVTYGSGSTTVISEKTVLLNISYPPQRLRISGERSLQNGGSQPLTGAHTEAQEGDTLWLLCEAEGNPLPQVTWVERPQSGTQRSIAGNNLTLYGVKLQDMGGYTCQAQNTEGTSETTFRVYMKYSPKICSPSNTSCWREEEGYRCNCSICSFPGPKIQWVVDGKTVEGNASNKEMEVTSWYKMDEATSTLFLKGTWDGQRSVLCSGNSSSGETSANFFLYSFKEDSLKQNVISGVVGAVIMCIVVAIILLIVLVPRKCRQTGKSVTEPGSCSDRSTLVFSGDPSDAKGSDVATPSNQKEAKGVPKEPEKPKNSPDESYENHPDLYYATIQFSRLKPVLEVTSEAVTTEYAEIKTS